MVLKLSDLVAIITLVQLLLFTIFLFNYKKGIRLSNKLLALFLFSNAMYIFGYLIISFDNFNFVYRDFFYHLGNSFGYLFGPTLFLYTKAVCSKHHYSRKSILVHLIPFAAYWIYVITDIVGLSAAFYIFMNLQILIYIIASLIILKHYRNEIKKVYSSIEKLNLSWLSVILYAFILMWVIDITTYSLFFLLSLSVEFLSLMTFLSLLINFVFANLIVFKSLKYPEILSGAHQREFQPKYRQSRLTQNQSYEYAEKLKRYILSQKSYLTPSITIHQISAELEIPSRELSQVINESFNQNFYDFINSFRIEAAKSRLNDVKEKKTVLEIAYEVGFNSKSAFNGAFKKFTGNTPTNFKKLCN